MSACTGSKATADLGGHRRDLVPGVNLSSKTFGERAEVAFGVPHLTAAELHRRQREGEPWRDAR
ncbi:hypothetical protein [Xylophilus sp. GOD-11R]|uniref:hypothetical protein n=1 Tax=Xylophilus sp. GOD-11R TaxID=3089814 RepID=UPI00298C6F76|nr:hypothetical protein [Xylophilus sp. GOD-11R]WPB56543.1 hypothetical protein R9X41_20735 [Xylophilus sp. GOD-11R]